LVKFSIEIDNAEGLRVNVIDSVEEPAGFGCWMFSIVVVNSFWRTNAYNWTMGHKWIRQHASVTEKKDIAFYFHTSELSFQRENNEHLNGGATIWSNDMFELRSMLFPGALIVVEL
jgi:hypothetical protein